ncbi:MAG: YceI family protein [Solirubrobacterales bacterium]|nr:YceI family protein [Solirubrobacterales bacterium]
MSAATPAQIPTTGTWKIDSIHSTANFTVSHNAVGTFRAQFLGISGSLENGVLSGSVPVDGIQLGLPLFKEHLEGEGFFDKANHPTLDFKSTSLSAAADGTVSLKGELTIKGTTKPIEATGTVRGPQEVTTADGSQANRLALDLSTTVDRREFGLEVPAATGWEVKVEVALELGEG